jgi:hypothetical protein
MPELQITDDNRRMIEDTIEALRPIADSVNDAIYRLCGLLYANPDGRTVGPDGIMRSSSSEQIPQATESLSTSRSPTPTQQPA